MRQSNVIFGTLIFAFIVFITMRGQLPGYLDLFKPKETEQKGTVKSSIMGGLNEQFNNFINGLKGSAADAAKKAAIAYATGGAG